MAVLNSNGFPCVAAKHIGDRSRRNANLNSDFSLEKTLRPKFANLDNDFSGEFGSAISLASVTGSVNDSIRKINLLSCPAKIAEMVVGLSPVGKVASEHSLWSWSYKCSQYESVNCRRDYFPVNAECDSRVAGLPVNVWGQLTPYVSDLPAGRFARPHASVVSYAVTGGIWNIAVLDSRIEFGHGRTPHKSACVKGRLSACERSTVPAILSAGFRRSTLPIQSLFGGIR